MSSTDHAEVVEEVSKTAESLENQQERLSKLETFIEDAVERVEGLDESKRRAFYEKAQDLENQVDQVTSVEALFELKEEIDEAIKSPLLEATLEAFDRFIATVGVELDSDDEEDLRENIENSVQSELEALSETYQELTSRVHDYPSTLNERICDHIETRPSILVADPASLDHLITGLERRYESLNTIQTTLADVGSWTPTEELSEADQFYQNLDFDIPLEPIKTKISSIDTTVQSLSADGLSVANPLQVRVKDELAEATVESLSGKFETVSRDISTLEEEFSATQEYASEIDAFGSDRGMFETQIDELLADFEQIKIQMYNTLPGIKSEVSQTKTTFEEFLTSLTERLRAQREMVGDLEDEFEDLDAPDIDEEIADETPLTEKTVYAEPLDALEASAAYDSWIEAAFSEFDDEFEVEEAMDIWQDLYNGDPVTLTDENRDAILALADRFTIQVVLGSG